MGELIELSLQQLEQTLAAGSTAACVKSGHKMWLCR
jgi:hypothetical protein